MSEELTARLEDLERRLRLVEDREEIIRLLYTLGQTVDYGEHDRWLDQFHDDVEFRMVEVSLEATVEKASHSGKKALADFIPGHTHAPEHPHKHLVGDPVVEVDGDKATAVSYMTRVDKGPDGPYLWSIGRYLDTFVRGEEGRWLMTSRTIEVDSRAVPVKASDIGGN